MSASSPSSPPHSPTVQAPSVPDPYEDEYVVGPGPHYASGSFILFEADVDAAWVESHLLPGAAPGPWKAGPLPIARRAVQSGAGRRQLLDSESIDRQHDSVTRALGRGRFRWHRHGRWVVRPTGRAGFEVTDVERQRAGLVITGLELLTVDPQIAAHCEAADQRRLAGVVIAHVDLTEDPAAVSSGLSSHLLADDMRNGIGAILRNTRTGLAAQVTQWLNDAAPGGSVSINDLPDAAGLQPAPIHLCDADQDQQAAVPIYMVLTGLWQDCTDAAESLGEYRYGQRGIAPRPQAGSPAELPEPLASLSVAAVRTYHADRLAGRSPLSPEKPEGAESAEWTHANRQSPVLASNLVDDEADGSLLRAEHGRWASTFTPTGAGFAYVPDKANVLHPPLRNDLSSVYSTVLALEMLKDHALTSFARASRELAHQLQQIDAGMTPPHPGHDSSGEDTDKAREKRLSRARDDALSLWRSFVAFTTEYWALTDTAPAVHQEVVARFQQAIGRDTEVALARTQANLERLASLLELEESRARAERERLEQREEKESAQRERRFNVMVGFLATLFLPLSVIPPVLEWYYPNDGRHALGTHWLWLLGISAVLMVGAAWWLRKDIAAWWRSRTQGSA